MRPAELGPRPLPAGLEARAGFLLNKAAQRVVALAEDALKPSGLKSRHYGVLVLLEAEGARSQQEIADRLQIDRTTMAGIVDDLERLGLAERRAHPANRRAYAVHLTSAGARSLPGLTEVVAAAEGECLASLAPAERALLTDLLGHLVGLNGAPTAPDADRAPARR